MTAKVSDTKKLRKLIKRCRWNVSDSILLMLFMGCSAALITTIILIWFPYLATSQFVPAKCTATYINRVNPMQCTTLPGCQTVPGDYERSTLFQRSTLIPRPSLPKTIYPFPIKSTLPATTEPPNFTLPENFTYDYSTESVSKPNIDLNFTIDENATLPVINFNATLPNVSFNPTTPSITITVPPVNPTGVVRLCPWFPCTFVSVNYEVTVAGSTYSGGGVLHASYQQMQNYPQCSYVSCTGNFLQNANEIANWLLPYINYIESSDTFICYVNTVDEDKIILNKQFSYAIAINSILWPALGATAFLVMLIAHQCYLYSLPPKPPKEKQPVPAPVIANGSYPAGQTIIYENGSVHSAGGCGHRCVCGRPFSMLPSIAEEDETDLESVVIEGIHGPVTSVHSTPRSSWKGSPPLSPRSPMSHSAPVMIATPPQYFNFDTKEPEVMSCQL